jgi:hypothetical protein
MGIPPFNDKHQTLLNTYLDSNKHVYRFFLNQFTTLSITGC